MKLPGRMAGIKGLMFSGVIDELKKEISNCNDVIVREIMVAGTKFYVLFIEEFTNREVVEERIIQPLLRIEVLEKAGDIHILKNKLLPLGQVFVTESKEEALRKLFSGCTLLVKEQSGNILIIDASNIAERAVSEPGIETVVRGPRDAFTENFKTNISLIRKRIKNKDLKAEIFYLGKRTHTSICLMYMEGIVLPDLLREAKKRLQKIDIDAVLESGYIEQFIEDSPFSPFPQVLYTERPDKVAAALLEGRVAIVVDGTPLVLIIPAVFNELFIAGDDYYERVFYGSFIRFFRFLASITGLMAPSYYIAFSSYHPELLPAELALALAGGRVRVPFPPIIEIVIMEFVVEILREASIRLPGKIGPTIGIVGALVLGEAAVAANLVSPSLLIIVAITAIGNNAVPNYSVGATLRFLRFFLITTTFFLGLYGLIMGMIFILIHLCSLKSFGVPYLAPYAPLRLKDLKDTFIRLPLWLQQTRPRYLRPLDKKRLKRGNKS